ncbi:MAG: pantoate--beta-alanine ligase [Acidobacteriota bacterium]|jgi:pantoate--beta-alanine ligase|nr:pantoate--beta-alanine ligase [Acidobacteriota bacterium]
MKVWTEIAALDRNLSALGAIGIGLVPTMGYLHRGHMSLVAAAIKENDVSVVSIFVNPSQFGPGEDLERYPRDLARDCSMLEAAGVDFVFAPAVREMYPHGFVTRVEQGVLGEHLCGRRRPGHFSGVLTVVAKLLGICRPERVYFGAKDAQQAIMVSRMIRDLNMAVKARILPIVRDPDGLALSSRNQYLSSAERERALILPGALRAARRIIDAGERNAATIVCEIASRINAIAGVELEYVEVVGLNDLQPLDLIDPQNTLVAAAVRIGNTRLIDNFMLGEI